MQQFLALLLDLEQTIVSQAGEGDAVVIMSNGGFGGLHQKLMQALQLST